MLFVRAYKVHCIAKRRKSNARNQTSNGMAQCYGVVVAASGQALICIILDILHVRRQKQLLSSRSHAPVYARNLIKNV